ncbi:hypothetical protein DAPPUDRAFT_238376 [Daphnia pulex]|uniref:Uncharacterized protein n=1 Tax=Daphnia pulex TaxID=6669 RepID=E9G688_DAPPU|nr:hypothetical protein DAPPUDRAFT_238376 [Daphnia pulex]|eukprot:EFX84892.1 hypothetical protein DAPPUDRAFT_238376 [Daphnia pulex]
MNGTLGGIGTGEQMLTWQVQLVAAINRMIEQVIYFINTYWIWWCAFLYTTM